MAGEIEGDIDFLQLFGGGGNRTERLREIELVADTIDREDVAGAHDLRQLCGRRAETAEADDGHTIAGSQRCQPQGVVRRRGRAHHHGGDLERDAVGNRDEIGGRDDDPFGIAAVDFLAEHPSVVVKIVQRHALIGAGHHARDLVAEGQRQRDGSASGTIVRIAVANAGRANLDDDLARPGGWIVDLIINEWRLEYRQTYGVHERSLP